MISSYFQTIKALIIQRLASKLVQNSIWAILAQVSMKIFGTLIWIMVARSLGAEHFGYFSFVLAFCMVLELLPNWGHNILLVRIFKSEPDNTHGRIFLQAFYLKIILTLLALLVAYVSFYTVWHDKLFLFPAIIMGLFFVFFKTISMVWEAVFTAREKLKYTMHMVSVENIVKFILVLLLFLLDKLSVFNVMLIFSISFLAKGLSGWWFSRGKQALQFHSSEVLKSNYTRILLLGSIPFVLTSAANYIYTRVDILVLSRLVIFPEELGWYGLVTNLIVSASLFGVGIATAFYPTITRLAKDNSPDFLSTFLKVYTSTGIIGFLIASGLSLSGALFIPIFFGESYLGAVPLLTFFAFVLPVEFWKSVLYRVYYARHEEKKLVVIILAMIAFNVMGAWILGSIWGYIGVGIATCLSKIMVLFLCVLFARNWIHPVLPKLGFQFLLYLPVSLGIIGLAYWFYQYQVF